MQITNQERIGRALGHLRRALVPFVDARLQPEHKAKWRPARGGVWNSGGLDVKDCLEILHRFWDEVFRSQQLGRGERAWVNELLDKVRNPHAHPTSDHFSHDDTWRAIDTVERLLLAIKSPEADAVRLLRLGLTDESPAVSYVDGLPQRIDLSSDRQPVLKPNELGSKPLIESLYVPDLFGGMQFVALSRGLRSVRFGKRDETNRPGPLVLEAANQIREYLNGKRMSFDIPLDLQGSPFQLKVWRALIDIPYGETRSYRQIAAAVGQPKATQAVGGANKCNPLLIIVPCHRVIAADGSLGGWEPGVDLKRRLLDMESQSRSFR
jgi:methylated-DNA-[protein]-cysteine S-methyltransferase